MRDVVGLLVSSGVGQEPFLCVSSPSRALQARPELGDLPFPRRLDRFGFEHLVMSLVFGLVIIFGDQIAASPPSAVGPWRWRTEG